MRRPSGITIIAALFALAALSLWTFGLLKIAAPNVVSLMRASPLMYGLELAGPYMALLIGTAYALVGWGLLRMHNSARWSAMLIIALSIAPLVPRISMAELGLPILWYGLQIAVRVAAGWYLAQAPSVLDAFHSSKPSPASARILTDKPEK